MNNRIFICVLRESMNSINYCTKLDVIDFKKIDPTLSQLLQEVSDAALKVVKYIDSRFEKDNKNGGNK